MPIFEFHYSVNRIGTAFIEAETEAKARQMFENSFYDIDREEQDCVPIIHGVCDESGNPTDI
jgi:hypothetical protein